MTLLKDFLVFPIHGQESIDTIDDSKNMPRKYISSKPQECCANLETRRSFFVFFYVLFLYFSTEIGLSTGADRISAGQALSGNQKISSKDGKFELGFFYPGNNSRNHYIGIWYKEIPVKTSVWVANRERPISDPSSAELRLSEGGNLVLFDESKSPIWSTNSTFPASNSTEAVLLDTGNLVLRGGPNSSVTFWQSFDHPTNTWLPGSKLGLDKRTNKSQLLTSWRSDEDPAPGMFALQLDPNGSDQYFIQWNGSERYWNSGPWNGQIFSGVPEMRSNYIYNFTYVDNKNESYFNYTTYDTSIATRFVMDVSGQIKQFSWLANANNWNLFWSQPRQQCEVHALCGAFGSCNEGAQPFCKCLQGFQPKFPKNYWNLSDWSGGCVRDTPLQCGNSSLSNAEKDKFLHMPNVGLPPNSPSLAMGSSEECHFACLNNCSCSAYAFVNGQCSIWGENLLNLKQLSEGGNDFYLRLAASDVPEEGKKKKSIVPAVVGAVAGVLVILGLVLCLIWRRQRRSIKIAKTAEGSLIPFGYRDLQIVTHNFSERLGGGGFGSVFKGSLPDSSAIAIKKLESIRQGEKQFRTEVSTIGTIQHVNLVRLRGFCSEGANRLLVYDYMPNGSLDSHLFHHQESKLLDWRTRYQIALGTARGLAYLHEKCRDCIIHCDIKPENILLDAEFCPKVADFGLAKLVGRDFSRVLTTMRGTRGYLAPEWISGVAITAKADVYSYGMMLFEIISGRRNSDQPKEGPVGFFPTWASRKITEGEVLSLLDPRLQSDANLEELTKACRIACWCIQDDETHRPSMGQVVQILEGVLDVNLPPAPRSLQVLADNQENIVFFLDSSSSNQGSQTQNSSSTFSQAKSATSAASSKS